MIVWINGPINAGKTTVAQRIAAIRPGTTHVEVDHLRHFATHLPLETCSPWCLEDTAELTRRWIDRGFNVVVSWPISVEDLARFQSAVPEPVRAFTLLPPKHVALSQRGHRVLTPKERRRIEEMYDTGMFDQPAGTVIDNQSQTPDETTRRILSDLGVSSSAPSKK